MKKFEEGKNVERVGMGGNGQVGKLKIGEKNDNRYKPAEWLVCRKLTDDDIDGDDADGGKGENKARLASHLGLPRTDLKLPGGRLEHNTEHRCSSHPSHIRR